MKYCWILCNFDKNVEILDCLFYMFQGINVDSIYIKGLYFFEGIVFDLIFEKIYLNEILQSFNFEEVDGGIFIEINEINEIEDIEVEVQ